MKKFLIILLFVVFTFKVTAQSGDGSSGNPFYGTISSTVQWSVGNPIYGSTVYVGTVTNPDLTVGTGGHLIIDPGITVVFTQLTSDLFITGTARLTAGGSGTQVTFTKDPAKSHWGHMSFQSMSGTPASSTINNCVFEYGYSTGTSAQPLLAGGALQVDFNNVTITNCVFRNNYANYAGAVMIATNRNTIIRNSRFDSNSADECGGAMITYNNSTALIENCIFSYNYSKGRSSATYSGGAIWSYLNSSRIVNCTFVENTSDRAGDAIYSYSSSNMRIINSILWGSNDQYAGASTTSTIVTCAFETTKPANAANSIIINAIAADHFNNAVAGDWSLKYISPCRDAGTNSYGSPNIVPTLDYLGNIRVLTTDIGAYEVQYSRWKTTASSTDWTTAGNWDGGVPTSSRDVIVPAGATNYPTGSATQDFTLGSNKLMILEQGARVTLDDLTNNGTLKLNYTAAGFASLIINSYTRGAGGTEEIQLYLTGGGNVDDDNFKWHYISTPVTSLAVSTFAPGTTLDVAQFVESRPSLSLMQGWVAYDGYVYSTGLSNGPTFSNLTPGRGYDYWDNNNNTFTFSGLLNTSDAAMSLGYSGTPALHGFNLLGNPFSSGLNWNDIVNSVYFPYPSNTSLGIYFTRDNLQCTYINGVGIPGDVTGIIPPMQGFFTKTYASGNTITLAAAARTHSNIHAAYKGKSEIPLVRLQLRRNNAATDETVVRFDEAAKSDLDYDFDALKLFISNTQTQTWTLTSGNKYGINGLPFPETFVEIPVVINITKDSVHTITASQLQGLDNYDVTLTDNVTSFTANLKTTPVLTFSAGAETVTDRFVLKISAITTGVEVPVVSKSIFNIYPTADLINIQTISDDWDGKSGSVRVLDLTGKTVTDLYNIEFRKDDLTQVQSPKIKGMYVVELRSGALRYVGKVIIK